MRTRVKICGITSAEDALLAANAGADAIGLVFYKPSPRYVTVQQAQQILSVAAPFVTSVGLFVNATRQEVEQVLQQVPLDLLQFHGDETPEFCSSFARPYIKALRMRPGVDISQLANSYQQAQGVLLDAWVPGVPGGTGQSFDWQQIPELASPLILAGGLKAQNAARAITTIKPWALDVSGGVEMDKGKKCPQRIRAFMQAVMAGNAVVGCDAEHGVAVN